MMPTPIPLTKTASNAAAALGRLVQLLADRGVLTADEVKEIAGGYRPVEFVE